MKTIISEARLKKIMENMIQEAVPGGEDPTNKSGTEFANEPWFSDEHLRNAWEVYKLMQDPSQLSGLGEFQIEMGQYPAQATDKVQDPKNKRRKIKVPATVDYPRLGTHPRMEPSLDPTRSPRTSKTKGDIAKNIFNKIRFLHIKSEDFYADDVMKDIYLAIQSGFIPASTSEGQKKLDQKIRDILGRPEKNPLEDAYQEYVEDQLLQPTSIIPDALQNYIADNESLDKERIAQELKTKWPWGANVFGNTKSLQAKESHSLYAYNADKSKGITLVENSVVTRAYKALNMSNPGEVYHYIMENCILPTGDDVEIAVAHFFHILSNKTTSHIDSTGTDIVMNDNIKIECKSSKSPNTIERGLHASFPEDNVNKYYVFISNRGDTSKTQIAVVNSMLLRFVLLISDVTASPQLSDTSDPDVSSDYDNKILHQYVQKFGNLNTEQTPDFKWVESTIRNNSEDIIEAFVAKTSMQFAKGNAEDFEDTVTFRVGNAKVMVRTQVNWGLSEEDLKIDDSLEAETDDLNESNSLYSSILKDLFVTAYKKSKV